MQKELEQIIKKYGLEGTRIQRGRQRLYPQREGLNATPEQLADLRSVLEGTSVKGFLEIKSGDVVIAANTGGAIEKAYDRSLIPSAQTELFKANTPVESRAKSPIEQDPIDSAMENLERMGVLIEQLNPDSNVVDAKDRFEFQASRDTNGQYVFARQDYLELLKQHPSFEGGDETTYEDLLGEVADNQKRYDRQVSEVALEKGYTADEQALVIEKGSPYVEKQFESGLVNDASPNREAYLTELLSDYRDELRFQSESQEWETLKDRDFQEPVVEADPRDTYVWLSDSFYNDSMAPESEYSDLYKEALKNPEKAIENDNRVVLAAFRLKQSPEKLEKALSASPYVQSQVDKGVPLSEMREKYISPIMAQYTGFYQERIAKGSPEDNLLRALENVSDPQTIAEAKHQYPESAQTLDPAANLKNTIAQGSATVKEKVLSATETLALAQKNMATFAKHVKHRGLKAWAKEQMPILQNKAKELVQAQAVKIGEYAKEQAPIVKDAAISGAKQVGETIVQFAKDQAPVAAEKAKAVGDAVVERIAEYTRLVDPVQVEQLGAHVLGNDGGFEGNTFDFKRGEKGVEISLKNGTTVFSEGKLNPKVDGLYAYRLNEMAKKVEAVKATPQVEEKKRAIAR